jgi:hypothetical protein
LLIVVLESFCGFFIWDPIFSVFTAGNGYQNDTDILIEVALLHALLPALLHAQ